MRKKLLSKLMLLLTMMVVGVGSAWAQTTVSMTSFSAISGYVADDTNISYEAAKGNASSVPGVYSNIIRVYQNGGTFTVTANNSVKINSVTLGSSMATTVTYSIDGGTASSNQSISANGNLTVSDLDCSSILFTCTGTDKNSRLYVNNLSVTYTVPAGAVAAPIFSLEGGKVFAGTQVTLTQADASHIIYTTNGDDPSYANSVGTEYTGPITVNEAMTIKAIAVDSEGNESDIVSQTYTVIEEIEGLTIDFEGGDIDCYVDWTFDRVNITTNPTISANNNSNYYASNISTPSAGNGTTACSITTKEKVASPETITFYISKESNNTTASSWYVEVSSDGSTWTQVGDAQSATSMSKGEWVEVTRDLTAYQNVYVQIRYDGSTAIRAIDDISITEVDPSTITVSTPTFSVAAGDYITPQSVVITCETEGASIYYTLDGTDPTANSTEFTEAITISTTTTLKAIAITSDGTSSIASATYTFPTILANIAALTAGEAGTYYVNLNEALVTYVTGNNAYMEDATGGIYIYNVSNHGLAVGDKITGVANVNFSLYKNLPEISSTFTLVEGYTKTSGNTVTPVEKTIEELQAEPAAYYSRYVKITDATVTSAFSSKNATIAQDGNTLTLRDQNSTATLTVTEGSTVDVVGHLAVYNTTLQFALWEQSQITVEEVVMTDPEVSLAHETITVKVGRTALNDITAPSALEFSYLSSDENVATVDGEGVLTAVGEGEATITISWEETEFYNAGTVTYTVNVVNSLPTYELVTDDSTLAAGDEIIIAFVDDETCVALSTVQNTNNRKATTNVAQNEDGTLEPGFDTQIITLEEGGDFLLNVGGGYLYAASTESNWMKTEEEADDNAQAIITIEDGAATITFQGTTDRNIMRYNPNNGNPIFSCYSSTSSVTNLVQIYRKVVTTPSGDVNEDGETDAEDVEVLVSLMLAGDTTDACDINGDGDVTLADVTALVNILQANANSGTEN